jgi:sugar (glycoside-pentoside-hexuronide) transporter
MSSTQSIGANNYIETNVKLSIGARINYAVAEFGYNCTYYWISAFLMAYLIDVMRIPAAQVSLLILAVRIFDAINDPYIGSLADKTRTSWGRYRPWILAGGVMLSLVVIAMFGMRPQWGMGGKIAYMWVMYIIVTLASTACNMPFGALNGCLTSNMEERLKASSMRMLVAGFGIQTANVLAVPLLRYFSKGSDTYTANAYFFAVLICCAISIPTFIWTGFKTREVVGPPPNQGKVSYFQMFKAMFSARYIFIIIIGWFATGVNMYGGMTMGIYYFRFVAKNPLIMGISALVMMPFGWIGAGFTGAFLYKYLRHKGKAVAVVSFIAAFCAVIRFFFPAPHPIWWASGVFMGIFGAGSALVYGMIGDAVDVVEFKTGIRTDGFLASFTSTALKFGGAVGPAFGALMLGMLNYNPDLSVQPPELVRGINMLQNLVPAGFSLLNALVYLLFWDLDEKKHIPIREELERRRREGQ